MKINPPASSNRTISRKKPRIMRHLVPIAASSYRGGRGNSTSSTLYRYLAEPRPVVIRHRKALTLQYPASIRAPMAAGATPPPLFFGRSLAFSSILAPARAGTFRNTGSVDHALEQATRLSAIKTGDHRQGNLRQWPIPLPPRRRRARLPAVP